MRGWLWWCTAACMAWPARSARIVSAKWRPSATTISPPRSGHTSALDEQGRVWLFGGYVEEASGRRVTNDVWCLDPEEGWLLIQGEAAESRPGPRLCSASCVLDGKLLVFAGWDPETEGTGGRILDDVWSLDLETLEWTQLDAIPRGPVSRHVAVKTASGAVVVHTFRCLESILVFADGRWLEQPTSGEAPSSRGLHSAAALGDDLVVFGGADKSGEMRCDAYALDTRTWTWRRLDQGEGPSPRAGSCAAALGDDLFLVSCGAERGPLGGLVPRADAWALHLPTGRWTQLLSDSAAESPRPRNAASLTGPLLRPALSPDDPPSVSFALHGGWDPFKETYGDTSFLDLFLSPDADD